MSLTLGSRLGVYEVGPQIGAGGMGEVYQAFDSRLKRPVALKVLPDAVSRDADRLSRLHREAELLASLNDANIAAIYGIEERDSTTALVMELIEGPTLDEQLAAGALPLDEALAIAKQVASGLEAAHERGVVHRDLKPANIKIRPDGTVKILDFGLAKALAAHSGPVAGTQTGTPTLTSPAVLTTPGLLLGTAAYMSPEQARGEPADRRSDMWAFGCVLFQMLTGIAPYQCATVSETLAAVLRGEPDWSLIPRQTPTGVQRLVRRCLTKDRKRRLADAATARQELEEATTSTEPAPVSRPVRSSRRIREALAWVVAGLAAAGLAVSRTATHPGSLPGAVRRFSVDLAGELMIGRGGLAISPDATHLVYTANQQLYIRALDQLTASPLSDTVGAQNAFFSPDGAWVGFWQNGRLKKVPTDGGATFILCNAPNPIGVSWTVPDTIVYGTLDGIYSVPAGGGTPHLIIPIDPARELVNGPRFLPDGRTVLFSVASLASGRLSDDVWDDGETVAQAVGSPDRKTIMRGGRDARYLPTGHLVYLRHGTLLAVRFDVESLAVRGTPVPVVDGIQQGVGGVSFGSVTGSNSQLSVSDNGVLAYIPVDPATAQRALMWVDRQGLESPLPLPTRAYVYPRISPDGTRLILDVRDQERDLWMWDFTHQRLTRFTFDARADTAPVWVGRNRIVWSRVGDGILQQDADGSGRAEPLAPAGMSVISTEGISPDGSKVVFNASTARTYDLNVLDLTTRRVEPLVADPSVNELNADVSPDGRWVAYASDETGHYEIYVRPFPDVSRGKWQVSEGGGTRPRWRPDGKELFYLGPPDGTPTMMAVPVDVRSGFVSGDAAKLFAGTYFTALNGRTYDVSADGRRFLMVKAASTSPRGGLPRAVIVENWFSELDRLVPIS